MFCQFDRQKKIFYFPFSTTWEKRPMGKFLAGLNYLFSTSFLAFFLKEVVWMRMIPILGLMFGTYNTTGRSLSHWGWGVLTSPDSDGGDYIVVGIVALILLACWVYFLRKGWQGMGRSFLLIGLPIGIAGLSLAFLVVEGYLQLGSLWFIFWSQTAVALVIVFCFSAIVLDRQFSGVVTVSERPPEEGPREETLPAATTSHTSN